MADLKCVVENCTYNKDCLCSKGDIMVGGKHACDCDGTCCESFAQKREGRESFSNSLSHPSHTISIDCEAVKCIYNSNYKCVADHVDIKGCGACDCRETACATFTEKQETDRKQNHQIRLDKSLQNADNKADDRIRRETAGTQNTVI